MQYVWDANAVMVNAGTAQPTTGNWVPMLSGAGGGGGGGAVTVTNPITIGSTSSSLPISGGTFTPNFNLIVGTGQVIIPAGVKSAAVSIVSGTAFIAARGPIPAGLALDLGGYDGRFLMTNSVAVGATGVGSYVMVNWEV